MNEFCHNRVQGSVRPRRHTPTAASLSLGVLNLRFSKEEISFLFLGSPLSCTYTSSIAINAAFIRGLEFFRENEFEYAFSIRQWRPSLR